MQAIPRAVASNPIAEIVHGPARAGRVDRHAARVRRAVPMQARGHTRRLQGFVLGFIEEAAAPRAERELPERAGGAHVIEEPSLAQVLTHGASDGSCFRYIPAVARKVGPARENHVELKSAAAANTSGRTPATARLR